MEKSKRVVITGKPARRIKITGKAQRRIDPAEFAKAMGAEPIPVEVLKPGSSPLDVAAVMHYLHQSRLVNPL